MEIVEKESFRAAGIQVRAGWNELHTTMPEAWKEFKKRYKEISGRKGDVLMDLSLDVDNAGIYTQLIGVETEDADGIPDDMVEVTIPAQKYIHHQHKGNLQDIASTFGKMYEWAKENGIVAETFKIDRGYLADGSGNSHDLYIKIAD